MKLLIKNGRIIDPATGFDEVADLTIAAGRIVAIKTLALGQEFEGEALQDARERFFREAETAGRLQHQNIVTIFDAGE